MLDCDDQNFCTTDSCVPAQGCLHLFNDAPCNDADLCTIQDHCNNGSCTGGELLNCNDDNPCTDDACTPDAGCEHTPNDAVCTDSNECTIGDHCAGGECTTTGLLTCDDQNFCTNDNCDPVLGCTYSANTQPCDDNDVCTANDLCADGICKAGPAIDCPDDGNTCTMEYCDPDDGCSAQSVPDCCGNGQVEGAEECDDGNQQDGDGCSADCMSGIGCSDNAEYHYEVVAGIWACVNNQIISTYQENNSMCAAGWTPATNKLVQGLPFPSHQQHQAMGTWHSQVMASNGGYIRTGQKRRGGCTPEAHGDIYINSDGSHYEAGAGWHDLFHGGPSCVPDTHAANNMSHKLAGVICVQGTYELPQ
jgi:cysteine-rich repeat protein